MFASSHSSRKLRQVLLMLAFLLLLNGMLSMALRQLAAPGRGITFPNRSESGMLPLYFEPNKGQTDASVRFLAHAGGGTLFFSADGVTLSLPYVKQEDQAPPVAGSLADSVAVSPRSTFLKLQFQEASSTVQVRGGEMLPGKVNYFVGSNPSRWQRDLSTYSQIIYTDLYPGINLTYEGVAGRLKGTYTLATGVDPARIRWRYGGAQSATVDAHGNLQIKVSGEKSALVEQAPVAWQDVDGRRVPVQAQYSVGTDGTISFLLGKYDQALPLTIDPAFIYSTYLGGDHVDEGHAIAADAAGNAYVTGMARSYDFPIANAFQPQHGDDDGLSDLFVTKLGPNGEMVYSTYLGGNGHDLGEGIVVDSSGNVYLSGSTGSSDFPTTPGVYQAVPRGGFDLFITKLNSTGSNLIYSTYLGGSHGDEGAGLAVDGQGNAYVAGTTMSLDYPTLNPFQSQIHDIIDAFVTKMNSTGSALVYSTYLGGDEFFEETALGVGVNSLGEAYVTGFTDAPDFPLMNPIKPTLVPGRTDAFVTKFSASGSSLVYSTYLGGDGSNETAHDIAVDAGGNAYVTGLTHSGDFPTVNAFQPQPGGNSDAFVTKINNAGTAYVYSTYLGGFGIDTAFDIHVDEANSAYVTGYTSSEDFPIFNPFQPQYGGFYDAFVTKFAPSGSTLVYSGYLGGSSYEHGRAVTSGGSNTYITGLVSSDDFPLVNALQNQIGGDGSFTDAFVTKISEQGGVTLTPTPTPVCPPSQERVDIINSSYQPQNLTVSLGATVTWTNRDLIIHTTTSDTGVWHSFDMYPTQEFPVEFDTPGTYPYHCNYHPNMRGVITVLNGCTGTPTTATPSDTPMPPSATHASTSTPVQPSATATSTALVPTSTSTSVRTATATATPTRTSIVPSATGTNSVATSTPLLPTATATSCAITFIDVPQGHTFYANVRCLGCLGIVSGYADGTFRPDNLVTRGQLAKIVSNAAGFQENPGTQILQDVPVGHAFYEWINRLTNRGYMSGYSCGGPGEPCVNSRPYFRPFADATRAQTSKIVSNAAQYNDPPQGQTFEDVPPTHPFYEWIQRIASRNIIGGYQCGGPDEPCVNNRPYFRPYSDVTRGQSAKIVANTFYPNCQTLTLP